MYSFLNNNDSPLYIETQFAWYILRHPSSTYREIYNRFYHPRRVTQIVVSAALQNPRWTYEDFQEAFFGVYDEFLGMRLERKLIEYAVREIADT